MYESDDLEIWNLEEGVPVLTGAQAIFNVVGRLKFPDRVRQLTYSLDDGPETPVFFNRNPGRSGRLEQSGDFNMDTLEADHLRVDNRLQFRISGFHSGESIHEIHFPAHPSNEVQPHYHLDFGQHTSSAIAPQQLGQVVDGRWQVGRDERGVECLEIRQQDSGLDRIILFGRHDWTTGYEINARLCVTAWTDVLHNIGVLFKWNPHQQGDGAHLPTTWSTGLGYYYSHCPGLRIRFGVNVHLDDGGNKVGDYVLREAPLSPWRGRIGRWVNRFLPSRFLISQIIPGRRYHFRMRVHPEAYALTVWQVDQAEPPPQLVVENPVERLPCGSVGVIAHHCGARIYEYRVSKLD